MRCKSGQPKLRKDGSNLYPYPVFYMRTIHQYFTLTGRYVRPLRYCKGAECDQGGVEFKTSRSRDELYARRYSHGTTNGYNVRTNILPEAEATRPEPVRYRTRRKRTSKPKFTLRRHLVVEAVGYVPPLQPRLPLPSVFDTRPNPNPPPLLPNPRTTRG